VTDTIIPGSCSAGLRSRHPGSGPDPWTDDRSYPLRLHMALGLPRGKPPRRCQKFHPGDGPCLHYATLLLTIGCVNEHVSTAESCACCAAELTAQCPTRCSTCGSRVLAGQAEPLYPGWTPPEAAAEPGPPAREPALRRALAALDGPEG
jgi:hypothetical protein